jgi:transposase-like protein
MVYTHALYRYFRWIYILYSDSYLFLSKLYLAVQDASKKWTMPIRNWKEALNRFMIEFEDRLRDYL